MLTARQIGAGRGTVAVERVRVDRREPPNPRSISDNTIFETESPRSGSDKNGGSRAFSREYPVRPSCIEVAICAKDVPSNKMPGMDGRSASKEVLLNSGFACCHCVKHSRHGHAGNLV